jgi:hypothetical protein
VRVASYTCPKTIRQTWSCRRVGGPRESSRRLAPAWRGEGVEGIGTDRYGDFRFPEVGSEALQR